MPLLQGEPEAQIFVQTEHCLAVGKVERFQQTLKQWLRAKPPAATINQLQQQLDTHYRIRYDIVDKTGAVTIRHSSRLHHIGIGRAHTGTPITIIAADLDIRIIATDTGELLRHLTLDTSRDYQPQNRKNP